MARISSTSWLVVAALVAALACVSAEADASPFAGLEKISRRRGRAEIAQRADEKSKGAEGGTPSHKGAALTGLVEVSASTTLASTSKTKDAAGQKGWFFSRARAALAAARQARAQRVAEQARKAVQLRETREREQSVKVEESEKQAERTRVAEEREKAAERTRLAAEEQAVKDGVAAARRRAQEVRRAALLAQQQAAEQAFKANAAAVAEQGRKRTIAEEQHKRTVAEEAAKGAAEQEREEAAKVEERRQQEEDAKAAEARRAREVEEAAAAAVAEEASKAQAAANLTAAQNAATASTAATAAGNIGQGSATDAEWANATIAGEITATQHLAPAQRVTCTPTDITNDFLDAAIRAAEQAAAAAGNVAVAQLEAAFDDVVATAQSGSAGATVSAVYDQAGDLVSGSLGAAVAGVEDATVPFCLKLPIAGQDAYFSGRVMVSVGSRSLSGVLTLLTHVELASYMFVTGASLAVTGLSASRPLCGTGAGQPACEASSFRPVVDNIILSGSFCGGAAQTCLRPLGDVEANARRLLGTMTMTHNHEVDTLVGTSPSVSVGQFAFVTIAGTSGGDEASAQDFVDWLGLAADIGAENAQLTVARDRSTGDVVPSLTFSPLFPSTDLTEQERSCALTSAFNPLLCALRTARTFMQSNGSTAASQCRMTSDEDATNPSAPSIKTTSLECDNGAADDVAAATSSELQSMSLSYSRGGDAPPAYSGHLNMKGELFNMFNFVHFHDIHLAMRGHPGTGPHGGSHNATLSGWFCIGATEDCEAAHASPPTAASEALPCVPGPAPGAVRRAQECRTLSGSMILSHEPTHDHVTATLPLVKISGIAYPLLQHAYDDESASNFLRYLGPMADVGIRGATMGMTRSHGKISPILRGRPFFPPLAQVEIAGQGDVCDIATLSPLRCALKTLIGLDAESETRTVLTVTTEADEQEDQGTGFVRVELSHGDTHVRAEWAGGTVSASVMITGEVFVLDGYAHVYDAHLSVSTGHGLAEGRFCLGSPENCAAEEAASRLAAASAAVPAGNASASSALASLDPLSELGALRDENTISGSIMMKHIGSGTDRGEGHVNRVVLGTFVDSNLRRADNGGAVETMLNALSDSVKSLEIHDAKVNLVRTGSVLGVSIKGSPHLDGGAAFVCTASDWHPVACALAEDAGRADGGIKMVLDTVISRTHHRVQVGVQSAPVGAHPAGKVALVDHSGSGPSFFVGLDYPASPSNQIEFGIKLGVRVEMGEGGAAHPVFFEGELTKSPADPTIGGKLAMHGVWTGVAGIDYLHAADLVVGLNVVPTTPLVLTRLELGGEICLGSVRACYGQHLGGGRFLEQAETQWASKRGARRMALRQQRRRRRGLGRRSNSRSLLQLANQEDSLSLAGDDPECEQTEAELNGAACRTTCASTREARKVVVPAVVGLVVDPTECAVPRSQRTDAATGIISPCTEFRHVEVVEREATTGYLPCRGGISKRSPESDFTPPAAAAADDDPRGRVRAEYTALMLEDNLAHAEEAAAIQEADLTNGTASAGVGAFIKARAYVSYDAKDPTKNFVMAMLSETTLSKLLDVLAENGHPDMGPLKRRLPPQLLMTGIYPRKTACPTEAAPADAVLGDCCRQEDLGDMINHPECFARFSYAPLRAQIVQTSQGGSIAVPHGVAASGVLNLLGHKIEAEIEISPTRFHVEGKMDPLTLGSVLTITRSETDAERGPRFLVDIQGGASAASIDAVVAGVVQVELEGYLSIPFLQTSAGVRAFIDDQRILLDASLQMFGLFRADLEIEASMVAPPTGSFLARISGAGGQSNENAGAIKRLIVSHIQEFVNRAFEFVDKMSDKADEVLSWVDQPAKICDHLFDGEGDRAAKLRQACKDILGSLAEFDVVRDAFEALEAVVSWIQEKIDEVKGAVVAALGIEGSQADEFSTEAKAIASQSGDDATPASSTFFDLDFLELGGELTDESNVIVRARAKFTLLGKAYDASLDLDVRRLVDSFLEWVLEQFPSVDGVIRDIKVKYEQAKNRFAEMWRELKDVLSPETLRKEGERVFTDLKKKTGADAREILTLAVSGDGQHLWAFNQGGRIAYKAGIGLDTFWQDIQGPESEVWGHSDINSLSVSHDGQHVWCVTNGGYVFHRQGVDHSWGKIATGMILNHDMRGVTVSGSGNKAWAIDDAPFHALGEELRNGDGGEIFERTGHVDSGNAGEHDLWEDLSVASGVAKCARQPGNEEDECGLGVQGAASYDGSVYWMVTRRGAPWYYGPEKKWIEAPRPSFGDGGRRRLLLVEENAGAEEEENKAGAEEEENKAGGNKAGGSNFHRAASASGRAGLLRSGLRPTSVTGIADSSSNRRYVEPMFGRRKHTSRNPQARPPTRALLALIEKRAVATTFLKTAAQEEEGMGADGRDARKALRDVGLRRADLAISSRNGDGDSDADVTGNRNGRAASFLDVAASTRVGGIGGGSACDENDECTSGFCGERWSSNCGCTFCKCGVCTHKSYTLNANAACGLDVECKYRYCVGNANGFAPSYGAGRCTSGNNGAKCYDNNGCKAGHTCVDGQCSNRAVGSACSSNGGCASGRCDVTTNPLNIDTDTCLYPTASRQGGKSCTLNDECVYGWCKDNDGGMTSTAGRGRCTTGHPGAECGDGSNCRSARCDETGLEGGIGTDQCLYPAASRKGGESCTLDDDCQWNFCAGNSGGMTTSWNTGTCTSGLPGAQCNDNKDCRGESECDNEVLGGISTFKCLYPPASRKTGQRCTLNSECAADECLGNSAGATTEWGSGECGGGLKWITVSGDGKHVFGVADSGDVMAASRSTPHAEPTTYEVMRQNQHPRSSSAAASGCKNLANPAACKAACSADPTCTEVFAYNNGRCCMKSGSSTAAGWRTVRGGTYFKKVAGTTFTWSIIPHNTVPMVQVLASNANGHPASPPDMFGVDTSGDIFYRASLATAWVPIVEAQLEKDRVQGAVCSCAHGTAAASRAQGCTDSGEYCHSCEAGWTLEPEAHKCIQCTCEHGQAATTPSACKSHGQEQCASCDAGRFLVEGGSACHVNVCACAHGTAAAGAQCSADGDQKCTRCNTGYALNAQTHLCTPVSHQICVVSGQVETAAAGAAANRLILDKLPTPCRPNKRLVFSVDHQEHQNRVDVLPSGEVLWMAGTRTLGAATSLSGLLFTVSPLHRRILTLMPGYTSYGGDYGTVEYSLNRAAGHCQVEGIVVRAGAFGHIATLPEECRPTRDLIFQVNNHASGARVDVDISGKVKWVAGGADHDWMSLTGIHFSLVTSGESVLTLANGYTHFSSEFPGSGYKRATYALGFDGKLCTVQGVLVHHGKLDTGATMATLPAPCRPQRRLAFVVNQHARSCRVDVMPSGEMVPRVGACDPNTTWLSLAGIKFATHSPHLAVNVAVASGWSSAGGEWGQVSEYVL